MIDKYSQAVANAMKGKCIPYKRETKAVLNEMLNMVTIKCGYWRRLTESEITGWDPNVAGYDPVGGYVCSNCGKEAVLDCNDIYDLSAYCPNCGAKMTND